MATPFNDTVEIYDYEVAKNIFDGGEGLDTLLLMGGGIFNFADGAVVKNFETIQGTAGEDRIFLTGAQLAGIQLIDGGGTTEREIWSDSLHLEGATADLTGKTISNLERIVLGTSGMTVKADSLRTASMIYSRHIDNDGIALSGVTLTDDQRLTLHGLGIDRITDATGLVTVNAAAKLSGLHGDSTTIYAGKSVRLDVGGNATLSDDRGAVQTLQVELLYVGTLSAYEKLRLTATDRVTFSRSPYESTVSVDGVVVGTYDGDVPDTHLTFEFNTEATPERVSQILRALTYHSTGSSLYSVGDRKVEIKVTDHGGRVTKSHVVLANPSGDNTRVGGAGSDTLDGAAGNDRLFGNAGHDFLKGGSGRDKLYGGSGSDKLRGGAGNDTLESGSGRDVFIFDAKPNEWSNKDRILDFSLRYDAIWLDDRYFSKLGTGSEARPKKLKREFFESSSEEKDSNDYLIYNKKNGKLYYDPDASGSKQAIEFAQFKKGLNLSHSAFYIV